MALTAEDRAVIRHLFHARGMSRNAISKQMSIHHSTVSRALKEPSPKEDPTKRKAVDDFLPIIEQKLKLYPNLSGKRLTEIIKGEGYRGSIRSVQRALCGLRGTSASRPFRLREVFAGEEAQVDWADLGKIKFGDGEKKVYLFIIVLSWSRDIFAKVTLDMKSHTFLRAHVDGFQHFKGIPKTILYDNLKSVVLHHESDRVVFRDEFVHFAGEYCFRPRPCNVRQPQEKGRVERAVRYIKDGFFAGRSFGNLPEMQNQLLDWLISETRSRRWPDNKEFTVLRQLAEERKHLTKLPAKLWCPRGEITARVRKVPYIHFESCRYSVPHDAVGHKVTLKFDDQILEIWRDGDLIAEHKRSWIKHRIIEDKDHVMALARHQKLGFHTTKRNALLRMLPLADRFFTAGENKALAARKIEHRLYKLAEKYGVNAVHEGMADLTASGKACIDSLELKLNQAPLPKNSLSIELLPESLRTMKTQHQDLNDYI